MFRTRALQPLEYVFLAVVGSVISFGLFTLGCGVVYAYRAMDLSREGMPISATVEDWDLGHTNLPRGRSTLYSRVRCSYHVGTRKFTKTFDFGGDAQGLGSTVDLIVSKSDPTLAMPSIAYEWEDSRNAILTGLAFVGLPLLALWRWIVLRRQF